MHRADEQRSSVESEERKWEARLGRLEREEVRLVDAYQAEAITLEELKQRREQLRHSRQALIAQRDQHARLQADRQAAELAWRELTTFCVRLRSRLDTLTPGEKQRILQLLVERVVVGEGVLEIRHVIPLRRLKFERLAREMPDGQSAGADAEGASSE